MTAVIRDLSTTFQRMAANPGAMTDEQFRGQMSNAARQLRRELAKQGLLGEYDRWRARCP